SRLRFALGIAGACALGAIGSLPQVLPMMEVASWSTYHEFDAGFFNNGNLKARFLAGLAGPWVLGGKSGVSPPVGFWGLTEHGIFQGVLPLAMLIVGLVSFVRRFRSGANTISTDNLPLARDLPAACMARKDDRELTRFWLILLFGSFLLMLG